MNGIRTMIGALSLSVLATGLPMQGARAADGSAVFQKYCNVCHSTEPGTNKLGPSLAGVVGRKSASLPDYNYSPAMQKANLTWDQATLDKYLTAPATVVPGTKMAFIGIKDTDERKAVIDYLGTLTD